MDHTLRVARLKVKGEDPAPPKARGVRRRWAEVGDMGGQTHGLALRLQAEAQSEEAKAGGLCALIAMENSDSGRSRGEGKPCAGDCGNMGVGEPEETGFLHVPMGIFSKNLAEARLLWLSG